ncbi:MAG: rhodanese-like domain-containing protein [Planctomycetes bacterium]|nr:rhodanese-like domain-containing protein [Planctomycetota bacterium]
MKKTITTEKLQSLRKGAEGFLLVDVLSKEQFAQDHIPGARNVPLDTFDFAHAVAEKAAGSKARKVVLYCSGPTCDASSKAAKMLVESGFTNVIEYEGGLASWNESKKARLAAAAKAAR